MRADKPMAVVDAMIFSFFLPRDRHLAAAAGFALRALPCARRDHAGRYRGPDAVVNVSALRRCELLARPVIA